MSIFISIAAYRDPELVPTVEDCLAKAAHPEDLRFGICWQHGAEEGPLPWADDPRFRIIDVPWQESRGACWARAEIMHRYAGEDYFLQLDSHHRFAERWDEIAIDELKRAPSAKPVLTTYATPFNPEKPTDLEYLPMQMEFDRFTEHGIILFRPGELRNWRTIERPARGRFLSAHFLFTIGQFVTDVPYDPELYFIGEEITMAVRAYTHGYDLFHPRKMIVWHEYTREYREHKHWSDHEPAKGVETAWHQRDAASLAKVEAFLKTPHIGPFGLGTVRTFADYEAYAGVNFARKRAQQYTRSHFEPPNPPMDWNWADKIRSYSLQLAIEKSRLPADVDDYHFWYVGAHDENRQEIYRRDLDREGIKTLLADASECVVISCDFDTDRTPTSWTVWPVSDSRGWLEKIEGPVIPQHAPVTLVTALLDLGRDALQPSFQRSFDGHYVPLFEELLDNDLPMVIHADPQLEPVIWRHRHPSNTKLVLVQRSDLEATPEFESIQTIRTDDGWRTQAGWLADSPQAALVHYNALVFSKMRWLADAARENPFGASHLYWIDAGLPKTVPSTHLRAPQLAERLIEATDDFLWVEYPYRAGSEIHGFPRRELANLAGVAGVDRVARGGFFGGRVEKIADVANDYDSLLNATLNNGLMGTEESLFTILAYRNPDRFTHFLVEENGLVGPFFDALLKGEAGRMKTAPERWAISEQPFPRPPEPDDAIEIAEDVTRGWTTFLGLPMMQNRHAILGIDRLLLHLAQTGSRPARIIELGTGFGGLSVLLKLYTLTTGAEFISYDKWERGEPARTMFERLDVDFRLMDVWEEFGVGEVARQIQKPGVTLLVCDGPNKIEEVKRFSAYLKTGDVVMAHDYAVSGEEFERSIRGRYWNWCEITERDIENAVKGYALEPVCAELLSPAAWVCKIKRGEQVKAAPRVQATSGRVAVYVLTYNAPTQLAMWFDSIAKVEPSLFAPGVPKVLLDNSTDDSVVPLNRELAERHGFTHVQHGNLGIVGGRAWCARHFAEQADADLMIFFEDDMLLYETAGVCRNGLPTQIPDVLSKAVAIIQNEPEIDFLKLSYSEFYGDHRQNWAYYNLDPAQRESLFPEGNRTRIEMIKSHAGLSYAIGEVHYSNWPMLITKRANDLLFMQPGGADRFEQTLMVHALELQRAGQLKGAVLLASPVNHDRQVHYEGGRKES